MKLAFIGTGYVGLTDAVGFAKKGNEVICYDIDSSKINQIQKGEAPIFEVGLEEMLQEVVKNGSLRATTDIDDIKESEIIFISVGTPSREDGSIDLRYIESASRDLGVLLKTTNKFIVVVVKSTVLPGTTLGMVKGNLEASGKTAGKDFGLAMCPEFFREGNALEDFFNPDRIVIGSTDQKTTQILNSLYREFSCPKLTVDPTTAEMVKYAANAFLAAKVSLINEIGNLCKFLNIDVYDVAKGVGADSRIGSKFLNAGLGFGGSCFPKDVKALIEFSKSLGYSPHLLDSVIRVNDAQPRRLVDILKNKTSLRSKPVAVLGLAFKPGTDDIRESRGIAVVEELLKEGANVMVYDPEAMDLAQRVFENRVSYARDIHEALNFSKFIVVATEWPEFKDESLYKGKIIIDGRKVLHRKSGDDYEGICW